MSVGPERKLHAPLNERDESSDAHAMKRELRRRLHKIDPLGNSFSLDVAYNAAMYKGNPSRVML